MCAQPPSDCLPVLQVVADLSQSIVRSGEQATADGINITQPFNSVINLPAIQEVPGMYIALLMHPCSFFRVLVLSCCYAVIHPAKVEYARNKLFTHVVQLVFPQQPHSREWTAPHLKPLGWGVCLLSTPQVRRLVFCTCAASLLLSQNRSSENLRGGSRPQQVPLSSWHRSTALPGSLTTERP
jgi:hypothetical protein